VGTPLIAPGLQAQPADVSPEIVKQLPMKAKPLDAISIDRNGKTYTLVRFLDDENNLQTQAFAPDFQPIAESAIPQKSRPWISDELRSLMDKTLDSNARFTVDIGLQTETVDDNLPLTIGSGEIFPMEELRKGKKPSFQLNGHSVDADTLLKTQATQRNNQLKQLKDLGKRHAEKLATLAERRGWTNNKIIAAARKELADGDNNHTITLTLTRNQIERLAQEDRDFISEIEVHAEPQNTLAQAMFHTGVNPHALSYANHQGAGIGIYMTELNCPNPGYISNYTRLGGTTDNHSELVSSILRGASPQSWVYCRSGLTLPSYDDIWGDPITYQCGVEDWEGQDIPVYCTYSPQDIKVVNMSAGYLGTGRYYTSIDRDWDDFVYNNPIATFLAAGNNHPLQGLDVATPAKSLNVTSIGNYDDANSTIHATSSYINSLIGNEKPEISFPGTNITAGGHTNTGTSFASPHAAAAAADFMSAWPQFQSAPARMKALMLSAPREDIIGGIDKVGVGGFDYLSANGGWSWWWTGLNGAFSYMDSQDYLPNNGRIDVKKHLDASLSKVWISLAWLNRGTYIFNSNGNIGMDMDLIVYDPNGNLINQSATLNNPYEMLSFDPQISGEYRFSIARTRNNDTASKIDMGLVLNY